MLQLQKMENKHKNQQNHTKLTQIQQVSEENQTRNLSKKTVLVVQAASKSTHQPFAFVKGSLQCVRNLLSYCMKKPKKREYDINQEEMTKEVQKIKKKKIQTEVLLPPLSNPKLKTLVLDMDETLISASFKKTKVYDFSTHVEIHGQTEKVYVTKRFGLDIFLFQMSQIYELVVFSAGIKDYTTRVLSIIDPQKRISHVLIREHCTVLNNSYFLKNLSLLGRSLKHTILIDDNTMAGMLQPENFYKIEPFYGDSHDRKLLRLIQFLKLMAEEQDFSCLLQKRKAFESRQKRPSSLVKKQLKSGVQWSLKAEESETQVSSHSFTKESRVEVTIE